MVKVEGSVRPSGGKDKRVGMRGAGREGVHVVIPGAHERAVRHHRQSDGGDQERDSAEVENPTLEAEVAPQATAAGEQHGVDEDREQDEPGDHSAPVCVEPIAPGLQVIVAGPVGQLAKCGRERELADVGAGGADVEGEPEHEAGVGGEADQGREGAADEDVVAAGAWHRRGEQGIDDVQSDATGKSDRGPQQNVRPGVKRQPVEQDPTEHRPERGAEHVEQRPVGRLALAHEARRLAVMNCFRSHLPLPNRLAGEDAAAS